MDLVSVPTDQMLSILYFINNECRAACLSCLFKVAPYWSVMMVLSPFWQLSNVKPTQVCSAPERSQVISTTLAEPLREL